MTEIDRSTARLEALDAELAALRARLAAATDKPFSIRKMAYLAQLDRKVWSLVLKRQRHRARHARLVARHESQAA